MLIIARALRTGYVLVLDVVWDKHFRHTWGMLSMTTKQLIRKLEHPPCNRIASVRIEFEDGSVYQVSPDTEFREPPDESPKQEREQIRNKDCSRLSQTALVNRGIMLGLRRTLT